MQGSLSQLRSWKLNHKEDDIRGWSLRDDNGRSLGTVAELVVDTDQKHVTEVVLGDGRRLPAHDIRIGEHELVMQRGDWTAEDSSRLRGTTETDAAAPAAATMASEPSTRLEGSATPESATRFEGSATPESATRFEGSSTSEPKRREFTGKEADLDDVIVPLIEEEVEFGKRSFEKGVTRVTSRVLERPFEHPLRLRDESVRVERKKVDSPLGRDEAEARLLDQRVEVLAITEHPITEKHARVVEEIVLKKSVEERTETLKENVRRTNVEITELPGISQELTAGAKP